MLRKLFLLITVHLLFLNVQPIFAQYNLVRNWVAQKPITTEAEIIDPSLTTREVVQKTDYTDGFGRIFQSNSKQVSPAGQDLYDIHSYDADGMETKKYLPFVSGNSGNNVTGPLIMTLQNSFNQSLYPGETNFYSQVDVENSPLHRPINTYAQGSSWVGSLRGKQMQYLVNTGNDVVQIWNISLNIPGSLPTNSGNYLPGQLSKTIVTDEKGLQSIEYKDLDDHIILKKNQLSASADVGTGSPHLGWVCTYYVYDDYGNMRFIITPKVVALIDGNWIISQNIADELCYRYEYDLLNHSVIKKNPGAGEQWLIYDQRGRVVMTQDANQRNLKKWQYFQYDDLDRPIRNGLITDLNNYNNQNFHQTNAASNISYPNVNSYPNEVLSQTFYDNYNWNSGTGLDASMDISNTNNTSLFYSTSNTAYPYAQPLAQTKMTRGMTTGSKVEVLESGGNTYLYTQSFYDEKGRIIQTQGTNLTTGLDKSTTQYSWSGLTLRTYDQHTNNNSVASQTHNTLTKMSYDNGGRLLNTTKTITSKIGTNALATSLSERVIASYTYNEIGQIKTKTIGTNLTTNNPFETLTYDYNVRGWLLGINRNYTQNSNNSNYFGMELGYDKQATVNGTTNFNNALYNGNVTGQIWKTKSDAVPRKYDFTYDNLDQLTSADFKQNTNPSGSTWDKTYMDFSINNFSYDYNGNIKTLSQNAFQIGGSQNIDNLTYNYKNNDNSNMLLNVIDNANIPTTKLGDFHYASNIVKTPTSIDYNYDDNGNLISDINKNIGSISYNVMNLPSVITVPSKGGTITYVYDAASIKLQKIAKETNATVVFNNVTYNAITITTTTNYVGGFVYQSKTYSDPALASLNQPEALQYALHEEGRFRPSQFTTAFTFVTDYFIKDNLGNVRVTLTDEQKTDTYPATTLESTTAITTEQQFYNINTANIVQAISDGTSPSEIPWFNNIPNFNYPNNNGFSDGVTINPNNISKKVYKLPANGGITGTDHNGLGITLKVMAGDVVNIFGKSFWHSNAAPISNTNYFNTALLSFLNAFTGTSAVVGGTKGEITGGVLNGNANTIGPLSTWLNNGTSVPAGAPKAGFNWILFDEQFKIVQLGNSTSFSPVSNTPDNIQALTATNILMPKSGYLYVFCSNESNQDVYFDNLQVQQVRSPLIDEKSYYPQGLAMYALNSHAYGRTNNNYGYQGKEMQSSEFYDGSGLDEYDFEARYYDPQLSRWHNQDPANQFASPYSAMGNNCVINTDPDGKFIPLVIAAGVLIGGFLNGIASDQNGGNFLNGFWKGALVGAVGSVASIGLSSIAAFSSLGMVGSGIINGAITGSITGGLSAGLNNSDIFEGIVKGGLWGGIIGGAVGAVERLSIGSSDFTLGGGDRNTGEVFKTNEELKEFINTNNGNVDNIQSTLSTKIQLASENNLPSGRTFKDNMLYNGKKLVGASTETNGGWFTKLKSNIFVSPGVKGYYYSNVNAAHMVINHEFLHAFHIQMKLTGYSTYSERATSAYSLAYAKTYNMSTLVPLFRADVGNYPGNYSWRSLNQLNILKLGIK